MINIKTAEQLDAQRHSCKFLSGMLNTIIDAVEPGVTPLDLEQIAADIIAQDPEITGAFLGYPGRVTDYANILCTSVNEQVVHCPPTDTPLQSGDIISIDAGVIYKGMYSDCAVTIPVGTVSADVQRLIDVTRDALYEKATEVVIPGNTTGDIGFAIQQYVEAAGFSIVKELVGHGIGSQLHEEPSIPNHGKPGTGVTLEPGMTIAIEPMVNMGTAGITFDNDGWRVTTNDGKMSAHFEHTFLVTEEGCEVLTQL